jgi:hypothetical protein
VSSSRSVCRIDTRRLQAVTKLDAEELQVIDLPPKLSWTKIEERRG